MIRLMTENDYERVYQLWLETPGMGLNHLDDSKEGICRYLKRNPTTCFVAEEEEKILGAILCGHDGRRGYISHTAVRKEYWGKGIGKSLVDHAMEALKKEGIHKTALVVFSENKIGNGFWEALGFTKREDLTYRNKAMDELIRIDT